MTVRFLRREWLGIGFGFGILALTFLVYARSLGNAFVNFDDGLLIYGNEMIRGITPRTLRQIFTSYDPELYIPLTFLSYQINYLIGGLDPFVYHLTNVLLHAGNAILVSWVVWLLSGKKKAAAAAGLLFAVHPLHVEAVAWASARKDLLSAFFFLLALGTYLAHRAPGNGRSMGRYWMSVLWMFLGCLSKVTVIMLTPVLFLFDLREEGRWRWGHVKEKTPFIALSAVFGIVALFGKTGNTSLLLEKILIGCKAIAFSLQKLFAPTGLSVLYPYTQPISLATPDLFASVIVVAGVTLVAVALRRRLPDLLFAWGFFVLMLLPTITNFAKGADAQRDVYFASDRYAYLSSLGFFFLIGLLVDSLTQRFGRIALVGLSAVVAVLSFLTLQQSLVWRDTESLFQNVVRRYSNAHLAHDFLGAAAYERGDTQGAIREYQASLAVRPNTMAHFNLGVIAEKSDRLGDAAEHYRNAIDMQPLDLDARINLGVLLLQTGEPQDALIIFHAALDSVAAHRGERSLPEKLALLQYNLGAAYEALGKRAEALEAYRKVLEITPADAEVQGKVRALSH